MQSKFRLLGDFKCVNACIRNSNSEYAFQMQASPTAFIVAIYIFYPTFRINRTVAMHCGGYFSTVKKDKKNLSVSILM